jgi:Ca2+-binding RTX toxin-like protein
VTLAQTAFSRIGNDDLRIEVTVSGTKRADVIIVDQFTDLGNQSGVGVEFARIFTDGTFSTTINLKTYLLGYAGSITTYGTSENDVINGILVGNLNDTIYGGAGNDTLAGDAGTDTLYGEAGNDILKTGDGADTLHGGAGSDTFLFVPNTTSDTIADFSLAQRDKIDLSLLLQGFDPQSDAVTDFVEITTSGGSSILKVDVDGGGNSFVQIATLTGVTGLTDEQALMNTGRLIVPGSYNVYPVSQNDNFATDHAVNVSGNLLANNGNGVDSDPNGDPITIVETSVTSALGRAVSLSPNGSFVYSAVTGYVGIDSFAYTVSDGQGGTDAATATITINAPAGSSVGTSGNNTLNGNSSANTLFGLGGNDNIDGGAGNDTLYGWDGNDNLVGGDGSDTLAGGEGVDYLWDGAGAGSHWAVQDFLDGGAGNDDYTFLVNSTIKSQLVITDASGYDGLWLATDFNNGYNATLAQTTFSRIGNDDLRLEVTVSGTKKADVIITDQFADLNNQSGVGVEFARIFTDATYSTTINLKTYLLGYTGSLTTYGTSGDDVIDGILIGNLNDAIYGGGGNDTLSGDAGTDSLYGEAGNDNLKAGDGVDTLYGGADADTFIFDAINAASDIIADFSLAQNDKIDVSQVIEGYDPVTHAITDWVEMTTSGANTILKVDANGGGDSFVQIATLTGVTGLEDEAALIASGHLLAA